MKYLIVGNSPFFARSIIAEIAQEACILALDGAAEKLINLKIKPDIILGDFDSLKKHPSFYKKLGITLISAKDQNLTDFEKALKFAMYEAKNYNFVQATSIHVVCATGGRMDHELTNFRALQSQYNKYCAIFLHNEYQTLRFHSNEMVKLIGIQGDYCGFFGMPTAKMSVKHGLAYGGDEFYELNIKQSSSANYLTQKNAMVEIIGDVLIAHPPMFESQRIYTQKSREEQLKELLLDSVYEKSFKA